MAERRGLGVVVAVLGALAGYAYAREAGAILGFVIGLLVGRSFERG